MINQYLEEQASLHVLGALNEMESRDFKGKLHEDADLQEFIARLSTATEAIAGAICRVDPPPSLRSKILVSVENRKGN